MTRHLATVWVALACGAAATAQRADLLAAARQAQAEGRALAQAKRDGHPPAATAGVAFAERVDALVESIDFLPTVCDALGIVPPSESKLDANGRNYGALDGHSVLPLLDGRVTAVREHSFAENGLEMSVQDLRWKLVVPAVDEQNRPLSLAGETLQSMAGRGIAKPRLYDLVSDPGETRNVIAENESTAQALLAALVEWDKSMPIPRIEIVLSPRDVIENARRMAEIGYGDGIGQELPQPPKQP